jgi:hypothetical protein
MCADSARTAVIAFVAAGSGRERRLGKTTGSRRAVAAWPPLALAIGIEVLAGLIRRSRTNRRRRLATATAGHSPTRRPSRTQTPATTSRLNRLLPLYRPSDPAQHPATANPGRCGRYRLVGQVRRQAAVWCRFRSRRQPAL